MEAVPGVPWSKAQVTDLKIIHKQCLDQTAPYIPSVMRDIGMMTLRLAPAIGAGAAVGGGIGAVEALTGASFKTYATLQGFAGLGSGVGSAIGNGIDRHAMALGYVDFACQQYLTGYYQRSGHLAGVGIIPWVGTTAAKPIVAPRGPAVPNLLAMNPDDAHKRLEQEDQAPQPQIPPT
jgi:hypothetical protein